MTKLAVIDNYDSFTFNLVQLFKAYPLEITVYRSDETNPDRLAETHPDYILISPGPKDPVHAGVSIPVIQTFYRDIPILGVCLGMQCLNEAFGGKTVRAPVPMHGKVSLIHHDNGGVFHNIPTPFQAARYHSLMIEPSHDSLQVTAVATDDVIMGISHTCYPLHGVQFHPESFMTEYGTQMIENFLRLGPLKNYAFDMKIQ
jgi:anthranilate synthase component 2